MEPEKKIDEDVRYFVPGIEKARGLRAMARTCFADTFGYLFDRESFEQFLDEAYGDGGSMSKDLLDSAIEWFTAETGGQIVGYAKLRPLSAPVPDPPKGALELQQIYVLRDWQGRGRRSGHHPEYIGNAAYAGLNAIKQGLGFSFGGSRINRNNMPGVGAKALNI